MTSSKGREDMTTQKILLIVALLPALCICVSAQPPPRKQGPQGPPPFGPPPGGEGRHGKDPPPGTPGHIANFLSSEMRFAGKVVKAAPYSATAVVESIQTLSDGTRISRKTTASISRDSEGRTRREQKLDFIGPFVPMGDPPHLIFIDDVVASLRYVINVSDRTARKMAAPAGAWPPPPISPAPAEQGKTESLGKQNIEGLEAEGTRSTITIPVGQIGNDRPIEIVSERWDSPELQVAIMSRHRDPRSGEIVYRLTNINRSEPERSLFEVPQGYTLTEGGPPDGNRGGRPPGRRRHPKPEF